MDLCNDGHDEVCYEGSTCPLCEVIGEREDLLKENMELEERLEKANDEIDDLSDQVNNAGVENGE